VLSITINCSERDESMKITIIIMALIGWIIGIWGLFRKKGGGK